MINGLVGNYNLGSKNVQIRGDLLLPYGANFALTRSVIKKVGLFDISLGVKGEEFERGEETDYFIRAISNGFQGMYIACLLYTSPSPRDQRGSRMPSSA